MSFDQQAAKAGDIVYWFHDLEEGQYATVDTFDYILRKIDDTPQEVFQHASSTPYFEDSYGFSVAHELGGAAVINVLTREGYVRAMANILATVDPYDWEIEEIDTSAKKVFVDSALTDGNTEHFFCLIESSRE